MPGKFAMSSAPSKSNSPARVRNASASKESQRLPWLAVVAAVLVVLVVGVLAQAPGTGNVSHAVADIDFSQALSTSSWPAGWPAPVTPTVNGVPVPEPLATMQKFVQAATWGTGSGIAAETAVSAQTANLANNSSHLETLTLAQVLALAGGNDTVYMKCPVAAGPINVAAPGQANSLQSTLSGYTAASCPLGASQIACPTIGGTTYTSKGVYFEPNGLGLSYVLTPNYASNGTIISYDISFFAAHVGDVVNVCTKNA